MFISFPVCTLYSCYCDAFFYWGCRSDFPDDELLHGEGPHPLSHVKGAPIYFLACVTSHRSRPRRMLSRSFRSFWSGWGLVQSLRLFTVASVAPPPPFPTVSSQPEKGSIGCTQCASTSSCQGVPHPQGAGVGGVLFGPWNMSGRLDWGVPFRSVWCGIQSNERGSREEDAWHLKHTPIGAGHNLGLRNK